MKELLGGRFQFISGQDAVSVPVGPTEQRRFSINEFALAELAVAIRVEIRNPCQLRLGTACGDAGKVVNGKEAVAIAVDLRPSGQLDLAKLGP